MTGPDGEVGDHLVVMRRLPAERRLSGLVERREPVGPAVRQVARILATQHASAARDRAISEQGGQLALRHRWFDNLEQMRALDDKLVDLSEMDEVERLAERFLAGRAPLLQARIQAGHIVDGHGDLLAEDIFCLDDGPRILDCLEFDDRLRWVDGLDDAAFLAMDLERLGAPGLGEQFTRWYAEFTGDHAPTSLRHHYVAYRALVRAKVRGLRAGQGESAAAEARQLIAMALRHLRAGAVTLVLIGGLPGTGKTTLAGALADRLGGTVLSSDRIRKELAGLPPEQSAAAAYGTGIYAPGWTERTYAELLQRAGELLASGESVILDASWISAAHRDMAAAIAESVAADLVPLHCVAPAGLATRRLVSRVAGTSDADPAVAEKMAADEAEWPAAVTIDTSATGPHAVATAGLPAEVVRRALAAVRPHGPEHVWRPVRPYMLPGSPGGQLGQAPAKVLASRAVCLYAGLRASHAIEAKPIRPRREERSSWLS